MFTNSQPVHRIPNYGRRCTINSLTHSETVAYSVRSRRMSQPMKTYANVMRSVVLVFAFLLLAVGASPAQVQNAIKPDAKPTQPLSMVAGQPITDDD